MILLISFFTQFANATPPLARMADFEHSKSMHFLHLEELQQQYLENYTKLIKYRYLLEKRKLRLSKNIQKVISTHTNIVILGEDNASR